MIRDSFLKSFRETKSPFITNPYRFAAGAVGGWVELARTTLGSASSTITVSSLADKRYYMVLGTNIADAAGGTDANLRLGNGTVDSGGNYAYRLVENGGSDTTTTGASQIRLNSSGGSRHEFDVTYIANLSNKEKLIHSNSLVNWATGAAGDIFRKEIAGKWANTSNPIDVIQRYFSDGGAQTGDEVVVLGWDPADTHTTNFWEELASVSGTSVTSLSTGTFTAKKYLWVQAHFTGGGNAEIQVGNGTVDTGSNYAWRNNTNGGSDAALASHSKLFSFSSNSATAGGAFLNCFIINNASNEKLAIAHTVEAESAGAGTAPNRGEKVGKWANTSNQINIIKMKDDNETQAYDTCLIKVWGSD
jgi:hypothetical protein